MDIGEIRNNRPIYNWPTPTSQVPSASRAKPERTDRFSLSMQSMQKQQSVSDAQPQRSELSPEQIKQLNDKYDYSDMSSEEYRMFLDDLVKLGVMTEEDKFKVGGSTDGAIPVVLGIEYATREIPVINGRPTLLPFPMFKIPPDAKHVNIADWAEYQSKYDVFYENADGTRRVGTEKQLYKAVSGVLSQMAEAKA